jgi:hypothetical protein
MKTIIWTTVITEDGFQYPNPLKISEIHLINEILNTKGVESVKVEKIQVSEKRYLELFENN